MSIKWIKTADREPPIGTVVLGYWRTVRMESVVNDSYSGWIKAPGYFRDKRSEPEYWAKLPDLPDGIERGE